MECYAAPDKLFVYIWATIWLIPKNAEKPVDRRRKENKSQ